MSATAAAPMMTGARPVFGDVHDRYFALREPLGDVKAVFLTHLFGIAFDESWWKGWAHQNGIKLIVDAAQSPFAKEAKSDRYAGTIGDVGVFSMNVHKHFQCGEGGVIVTDSDLLADYLRAFINHAEHVHGFIGLNLRMPEICAAIALAQLRKGQHLVNLRVQQAMDILDAIGDVPGLWKVPPYKDAMHVYYTIPFTLNLRAGIADSDVNAMHIPRQQRTKFCDVLRAAGVPIIEGYQEPLYRMPAFKPFARSCPIAEDLQDRRLFYIENCAWTFSKDEIRLIGDAFKRAAECLFK